MDELRVDNGDVTLRVDVTGDGPVVLCVHGWPELAHSWRHQMAHLSSRGYRVAALDVRGYGGSSAPPEIERYRLKELASDVAAVAAALGEPVVLLGHDWGSPIASNAALRHAGWVRAIALLSVPYNAPLPMSLLDLFDQMYADRFFYQLYFAEPGRAEADFSADLRDALKRSFYALSGDSPANAFIPEGPRDADFLPLLPDPPAGALSFLSDDDLDAYVATFERTGMTGAFNRYRAAPFDAADVADLPGTTIDQPSCFIGGSVDAVRHMVPGGDMYADPGSACTDFRGSTIVDGAGHWVHQEAPDGVNAALDAFLDSLS